MALLVDGTERGKGGRVEKRRSRVASSADYPTQPAANRVALISIFRDRSVLIFEQSIQKLSIIRDFRSEGGSSIG